MGFFTDDNNVVNETNIDGAVSQTEVLDGSNTGEVFKAEAEVNADAEVDTDAEAEVNADAEVDTEEENTEQECDFIISAESFERFASVIGFLFGVMINWGSLNIVGFMIGLNYKYLMSSASYNKIVDEVQTIIPAFMLGVLIVHLSLIYFTLSVFVGYAVKSKNVNFIDENFLRENSIRINIRNYRGVFYELLGIYGNEKKES